MADPQVEEDQVTQQIEQLQLGGPSTSGAESAPEAEPERRRGTVRWFNASKGFGFIQPEGAEGGSEDLFVHQTSIQAEGFRSLRESEPVEYELEEGEDGRCKAVKVTGPDGAPPLGAPRRTSSAQPAQQPYPPPYGYQPQPYGYAYVGGYGRGRARVAGRLGPPSNPGVPPPGAAAAQAAVAAAYVHHGAMMQQQQQPRPGGRGLDQRGGYGPMPIPGYAAPGYGPAGYVAMPMGMLERPPPPGTPGVSSGLQVVVHNLPWTCTWQQLKDAFTDAGVQNVERADVIIDSAGRSRGFGVVSFPTQADADAAVERTNGMEVGGRTVTVRIDRFA